MPERDFGLEVKESEIQGFGVFSIKDFAPGERVIQWGSGLQFARFLNHSCVSDNRVEGLPENIWENDILRAGPEGIHAGQEVTFNYKKTRWLEYWKQTVDGHCGCPQCREA